MSWTPYKRHCDYCGKYYEGLGKRFCSNHCSAMARPLLDPVTRFWSKVDRADLFECWNWIAGKTGAGYGAIQLNGRPELAHRFSWKMAFGEIPEGMFVCHHCDNPACVNPAHLFLGTPADNTADMIRKGRRPCQIGEANYYAKLKSVDIVAIRQMREEGLTHAKIAARFGVNRKTIGDIINRKNWAHV